jgi:TPR repeat protein
VVWIGFVVIIAGGLVRVAIDLRTPPSRAEQAASRPQIQIVPRMVASTTQPSGLAPARTAVAPPNHPAAPAAAITAGTTLAEAIARPPAGQATGTDAPAVAPRRETQARDAQPHAPEVPPPPRVATSDGARTAAAIPQPTPAPPGQADTARPAPALHDDAGPAASSAAAGALLARGHTLLAAGDVVSARLLYERAATSGSAAAAIAAGMTHDPRFLIELGTQGTVADPQAAARWYRRAAALGDNRAGQLLAGLGVRD